MKEKTAVCCYEFYSSVDAHNYFLIIKIMKLFLNIQIRLIYVVSCQRWCTVWISVYGKFSISTSPSHCRHNTFPFKWIYTFRVVFSVQNTSDIVFTISIFCTNDLKAPNWFNLRVSVLWSYSSSFHIALLGVVQLKFSLARQVFESTRTTVHGVTVLNLSFYLCVSINVWWFVFIVRDKSA